MDLTNDYYSYHILSFLDASIMFYKMVITNNNIRDIRLKCNVYQKKDGKIIKSSQLFTALIPAKTINLTRIGNIDTPPLFVKLTAIDLNTKGACFINEQLSIKLSPFYKNVVIIGDFISERPFVFKLRVTNLTPNFVALNYSLNSKIIEDYIPPYYFNYITMGQLKSKVTPKPIHFNSFIVKSNQKLLTNDLPLLNVITVLKKNLRIIQVYLSNNITAKNLSLYFKNPTTNSIKVKWKTTSFKGENVIPKQTNMYPILITTNGGYRKQKVFVEAVGDSYGNILVNLNANFTTRIPYGKEIVVDYIHKYVTLKNLLSADVVVFISLTGFKQRIPGVTEVSIRIPGNYFTKNGLVLTASNVLNNQSVLIGGKMACVLYLGDMFRVIEIGSKKINTEKFFVKLWVSNNNNNSVGLQYKKDDILQTYLVPKGFNKVIILSFKMDTPLFITAIDQITMKPVYLNQRDRLKCFPLQSNKYATAVVISGEIYLYDYFYRLSVNNNAKQDIQIQLENDVEKLKAIVPANSFNYSINTPLSNLKLGPKQPMNAVCFRESLYVPLYINNLEFVVVYPTLNDEDATVINVDGSKLLFKLFFYSMLVTVPKRIDVILKYTLDNELKLSRIPKASVNFSVTIPFHSFTTPGNISITAYNENNSDILLVNGYIKYTITPNLSKEYKQPVIVTSHILAAGTINKTSIASGDWVVFYGLINNPNIYNVKLMWTYNDQNFSMVIPRLAKLYKFKFNTSSLISQSGTVDVLKIVALSVFKNLKINGNYTASLQDSSIIDEIPIFDIELNPLAKIMFVNKASTRVLLRYQTDDKSGKIVIPKKGIDVKVPVGERIKFVPISQNILLNDQTDVAIKPSKISVFTVVLTTSKYQLSVNVHSLLNIPIYLYWVYDNNEKRIVISSQLDVYRFTLNAIRKPKVIKFSAHDNNEEILLLNNKTSLDIFPITNNEEIILTASKPKSTYHYSILFNNNLTVPVKINCVYNKTTKIFELNANEMTKKFQVAVQSKDAPDPMNCTSSSINPGIKPILNGKTASIIIPNIDIKAYKKIDVTLPIDTYYISLVVTNLINTNVNLKWNGSKRNGIELIPQNAKNKTVIILFTTKTDIKLFATNTTRYRLLVNLKESIQTATSRYKQRTLYVEISKRKINYYFSILFNNKLTVPVKINCVYNKVTKIFELNANEMKKKFQVALQSKDAPDPMNCTSSSINPGIKPILNGKTASIIIPNIDIKSYKKIDVTLPIDTYYISLVVTNLINTNVNLKWNGSKRNGIEVIPQKC